jgi:uncharacterized protein with ATP-grasp and redox domains
MKSHLDCIPCFGRQALDALRETIIDEETVLRAMRRTLTAAAQFDLDDSPPVMAQQIHRIIREETGSSDPYEKIKARSTAFALGLLDDARAWVSGSIDPFKMALRFSIAGNILDFGVHSKWDRLHLANFIEEARLKPLDDEAVATLRTAVKAARTILFLGDNAGETVFDRLLIEQMPHARICYAVKGSPVINDATLADARTAGLDQTAELIDNGTDAPGTILSQCSDAFRMRFDEADLVIAKGQANYETLSSAPRPLFFLTQVKCPVLARDLGEPVGSWIVKHHSGSME